MAVQGASTQNFIASQTVTGSAASSVTFSNIPQNYTDLVIVASGIGTSSTANVVVTFNGDGSAAYSRLRVLGNGSAVSSERQTGVGSLAVGDVGSEYFTLKINVMNYSSTNKYKSTLSRCSSQSYLSSYVGSWASFNPVTSLTITPSSQSFAVNSTFTIYGIKAAEVASVITPTKAIGGDLIVTDGTYTYHVFKTSGTFIPAAALTCDYLVVAGGGGGGNMGGGGGAGGTRSTVTQTGGNAAGLNLESALSLTAGTSYAVTIGAGGADNGYNANATNGTSSVFGSISTVGGGGGNGYNNTGATASGGSGGGGNRHNYTGGGSGTANQGYAGGSGGGYSGSGGDTNSAGGGGGGAGANGGSFSGTTAGNGGNGIYTAITDAAGPLAYVGQSSSTHFYFAGGGGGGEYANTPGTGGLGGGGNGQNTGSYGNPATSNTGGGGGGGGTGAPGGNGASGIVIVRYAS